MRIKSPSITISKWGSLEGREREWLAVAGTGTLVYVIPAAARGPESTKCMHRESLR